MHWCICFFAGSFIAVKYHHFQTYLAGIPREGQKKFEPISGPTFVGPALGPGCLGKVRIGKLPKAHMELTKVALLGLAVRLSSSKPLSVIEIKCH